MTRCGCSDLISDNPGVFSLPIQLLLDRGHDPGAKVVGTSALCPERGHQ